MHLTHNLDLRVLEKSSGPRFSIITYIQVFANALVSHYGGTALTIQTGSLALKIPRVLQLEFNNQARAGGSCRTAGNRGVLRRGGPKFDLRLMG